MDQDAFRSLLNQPRASGSDSSRPSQSRGTLGGARKDRFSRPKGKGRSAYEKEPEPDTKASATQFRPRSQQKKEESSYKDRAAMRRQGDGGEEYKHVQQVLADFERRKAEAGTDADKVESQRAFLGGDAEHSVLVKGLDFALLAKRKAELEREKGNQVEDELEALGSSVKAKPKVIEEKKERKESNKFKAIGDKGKGKAEEKEKPLSLAERERRFKEEEQKKKRRSPSPPRRRKTPSPAPDPMDEEDIFADAGAYDLNAGREDEDDDSDDEDGQVEPRGRSRSRSRSRGRDYDSRSRSRSRDRRRDSRSRSYDRYDDRRRRDDSPPRRRYSRSPSYDRYDHRERDRRRYSPSPRRSRSPSYDRYDRRDRDRRRYSRSHSSSYDRYDRRRSPSRTPPRKRSYSRSSQSPPRRSPSPKRRRERERTRSLSPVAFDPAFLHPPSDSESDEDSGPVTRLKGLADSASARELLAMDDGRAAADRNAVRKFKMRAAQGLGAQEGFDMSLLHDKKNEGHRLNREYQAVMNHMKKSEKK